MAKQVETRNRFRIFAEVEAEELGPRLIQLEQMGLQNIGHELVTDVITFRNNPDRKVHETTGDEFAREWLKEHPTFRVIELVNHFRAEDRTPGSAYTAVRNLITTKELIKTAPGSYRRADVKTLAAPKHEAADKKRPANPVYRYDVGNRDLVIKAMKGRKQITTIELAKLFTDENRNPKSVSPIVTKLVQAKQLQNISPGVYKILPTPAKEKDRLRKQAEREAAKAARLNGATQSTETTHG